MDYDALVIGAGIAGASAAYELGSRPEAAGWRILVAEAEDTAGYHSTGRSAAVLTETYGNPVINALVRAGRGFLDTPPDGFADHPLLAPRGIMHIGREDQVDRVEAVYQACRGLTDNMRLIDGREAEQRHPLLRPGYVARAAVEPDAMDMDVAALHQGYLRGARAGGAEIVLDAGVAGLAPADDGGWRAEVGGRAVTARIVVNAAGAWADAVAERAGLRPLGLTALRRTLVTVDPPGGPAPDDWPMTIDADEEFYFKPDAGRLLLSPADATPDVPGDVQPDELDVAIAVDRVQNATTLEVRHLASKWAGLRPFFADKVPAVGYDPDASGFFWLAGQGGYGIMTAPALARVAATLLVGAELPAEVRALGVEAGALDPARLR